MRKLIIVESPTKARTISKFLPSDSVVLASMGHIVEIPEKGMNVDLKTFIPKYTVSANKREIVKKMKSELDKCDELYLATDEDREGESISYHIVDILKPNVPTRRMVFHEITKNAILRSLENTRDIDMDMVNAQEARRVLDRLFGFKVSPLLWSYLNSNHLSAGRVQSPTLRLVVDREYKRLAFVSAKYNIVKAKFKNSKNQVFEAGLSKVDGVKVVRSKEFFDDDTGELIESDCVLLDDKRCSEIIQDIKDSSYVVSDIIKREVSIFPPIPFITSTLQQDANRKFHFSAKDTMKIAQELYERGLITYMRTDSPSLSQDGLFSARRTVESNFGSDYLSERPRVFKSKDANAQEAHEAIRPAIISGKFQTAQELGLTGRFAGLYELIYKRTLACQMKDNIREVTTLVVTDTQSGSKYEFTTKGYVDLQLGFKKIYTEESNEAMLKLPNLSVNEDVALEDLEVINQHTNPPKRWTEATLIKEIEKLGIGRPSTYATIISALISRNYIIEKDNFLIPTFLGFIIIKFLSSHLSRFIDYKFTSKMEESLDEIESHKTDKYNFLNQFYNGTGGLAESLDFKIDDKKKEMKLELPQIKDLDCDVYFGKFGTYILKDDRAYSVPQYILPCQLDEQKIKELIDYKETLQDEKYINIGTEEKTGDEILFYPKGRFGAYFAKKHNDKIFYFSLPKGSKYTDWSIDEITKLFSLPLVIGKDDSGNDIVINIGKYGPYISCNGKNASYKNLHDFLNLDRDSALDILLKTKDTQAHSAKRKRYIKK